MNKLIVAVNVLLVLAVGYLLIDRFSSNDGVADGDEIVTTTDDTTATAVAPVIMDTVMPDFTARNVVVAYIDIDSITFNYAYYQALKDELEKEMTSLQGKIRSKEANFQKELEEMERKSRFFTKQEEMDAAQKKLGDMQQAIQVYQERESYKLQDKEIEMNARILTEIRTFLTSFATENGIDYVMGYTQSQISNVMYCNSDFDITGTVINGLNREYLSATNEFKPTEEPAEAAGE